MDYSAVHVINTGSRVDAPIDALLELIPLISMIVVLFVVVVSCSVHLSSTVIICVCYSELLVSEIASDGST